MTLGPDYGAYLATRDKERSEAVERLLAGLTERERGLIHDAAVMGYVQAVQDVQALGLVDVKIPKDSVIVDMVVDACLAFPDLYPTINTGICARCGSGVLDGEHLRKDQPPCYPTEPAKPDSRTDAELGYQQ